jgi:hypothetical protein
MYLKKHRVRGVRLWLRSRFRASPGNTPGRTEALNVARLAACGVASLPLVAYGEQLHSSGVAESFVLTEELVGYAPLDAFLRDRFTPLNRAGITRRNPQLLRLIGEVASVAGAFHGAGFNHRDFYCCHFFVRETAKGGYHVRLIDLQRVEQRRWFRGRWLVKDLAQLAYSTPCDRISRSQQLAFFKRYLGIQKLQNAHKALIRRVLARRHAMQRRLGAHP